MEDPRNKILRKIKELHLEALPLPEIPAFDSDEEPLSNFKRSIVENKGDFFTAEGLTKFLAGFASEYIYSADNEFAEYSGYKLPSASRDLDNLQVAILNAEFGVSENGAMWLPEALLPFRVMPFITQHLIIVLQEKTIVRNMHEAYEKIGNAPGSFGVFIAGPSKTADIEQSLVVGAHGARSLNVLLR